jgi:hypothetical protein
MEMSVCRVSEVVSNETAGQRDELVGVEMFLLANSLTLPPPLALNVLSFQTPPPERVME